MKRTLRTLLFVLLGTFYSIIIFTSTHRLNAQSEQRDVLIYSVHSYGEVSFLRRYDPNTKTDNVLYRQEGNFFFEVSPTGMIVIASNIDDFPSVASEMLLLDSTLDEPSLTNLSQLIGFRGYPMAWSKDGQKLAFISDYEGDNLSLYIWDGETTKNIMPVIDSKKVDHIVDVEWSNDDRLSFGFYYDNLSTDDVPPGEIFLWDGTTTVNLSQNPIGGAGEGTWNSKNEFAFLSATKEGHKILVWDGLSYKQGTPDSETFNEIEMGFIDYFSSLSWLPNGQIAFTSAIPPDKHMQVYVWNGKTATNISQNSDAHNGGEHWSGEGYWAFTTYFSPEQLIFIRNTNNETILETEGQYSPAWSSNNQLAFCRYGWSLQLWNENQVSEIASGNVIYAQWQSGNSLACTSG